MKKITERDLQTLIESDQWMMKVLRTAEKLNLSEWWIGAGFLRNKVWDYIEDNTIAPDCDVDLVYFNSGDTNAETDHSYDKDMNNKYPFAEWEVRNQARMHYKNNLQPFYSTSDGIAHWVETATCVAVKLDKGKLKFLFCHGTDDLFGLIARPIGIFQDPKRITIFIDRVESKKWRERWPDLKVLTN
ncbi:MAG TPA: nucleotidyltransferase family protein [Candidatus Saccharimonadales bacterium]|nr:nucleotidyltransferase family protein [Candidatus Saccharimonadales bacterium]